jgi:DNA-directed RNA polymerase specialized sigma24 family protein
MKLAEFLAALPPEERFILTLHYLQGVSPAKIAAALQVPERAVLSVISAGKARLLAALEADFSG